MSPRRNRPTRRGRRGAETDGRPHDPGIIVGAPAGWQARTITAERALKEYRCPGCDQEIRLGTAHVVAWQPGRDDERRHWHAGCWRIFVRGGP